MLTVIAVLIVIAVTSVLSPWVEMPEVVEGQIVVPLVEEEGGPKMAVGVLEFDGQQVTVDEWLMGCEYYDVPCYGQGEPIPRSISIGMAEVEAAAAKGSQGLESFEVSGIEVFEDGSGSIQINFCLAHWGCDDRWVEQVYLPHTR